MAFEEKIKELSNLAEKRGGYVTYSDVNVAFQNQALSPEELDRVYVELLMLGVQITDSVREKE